MYGVRWRGLNPSGRDIQAHLLLNNMPRCDSLLEQVWVDLPSSWRRPPGLPSPVQAFLIRLYRGQTHTGLGCKSQNNGSRINSILRDVFIVWQKSCKTDQNVYLQYNCNFPNSTYIKHVNIAYILKYLTAKEEFVRKWGIEWKNK